MPLFHETQIPPPKNWQEFESLCCDLWRCILNDNDIKKVGRLGQSQNGVDIIGRCANTKQYWGIQCKVKSYQESVTTKELEVAVDIAKSFDPPLDHFIYASTGVKDSKIEMFSRNLTSDHAHSNLFSVSVFSWDDIVLALNDYPHLIFKHYHFIYRSNGTIPYHSTILDKLDTLPVHSLLSILITDFSTNDFKNWLRGRDHDSQVLVSRIARESRQLSWWVDSLYNFVACNSSNPHSLAFKIAFEDGHRYHWQYRTMALSWLKQCLFMDPEITSMLKDYHNKGYDYERLLFLSYGYLGDYESISDLIDSSCIKSSKHAFSKHISTVLESLFISISHRGSQMSGRGKALAMLSEYYHLAMAAERRYVPRHLFAYNPMAIDHTMDYDIINHCINDKLYRILSAALLRLALRPATPCFEIILDILQDQCCEEHHDTALEVMSGLNMPLAAEYLLNRFGTARNRYSLISIGTNQLVKYTDQVIDYASSPSLCVKTNIAGLWTLGEFARFGINEAIFTLKSLYFKTDEQIIKAMSCLGLAKSGEELIKREIEFVYSRMDDPMSKMIMSIAAAFIENKNVFVMGFPLRYAEFTRSIYPEVSRDLFQAFDNPNIMYGNTTLELMSYVRNDS